MSKDCKGTLCNKIENEKRVCKIRVTLCSVCMFTRKLCVAL